MSILTLSKVFEHNSEKEFVHCVQTGKSLTYGELLFLSLRFAQYLIDLGLKKGDKVTIMLPNCLEYILLYFACMHIGVIAVPINSKLTSYEIGIIVKNVNPNLFISSQSLSKKISLVEEKNVPLIYLSLLQEVDTKNHIVQELYGISTTLIPFYNVEENDIFVIVHTSGTTNIPKGVVICYENLIKNGLVFIQEVGLRIVDSIFYGILDLSYLGGIYNLMMIPFLTAGSLVLDKTFGPELALRFWNTIEKYKINTLWLVPSIIAIILHVDREEKSRIIAQQYVKLVLIGTAPLTNQLRDRFEKHYSILLYENYGLSETLFISTNSPMYNKRNGVGKVLNECNIQITDIQTHKSLPLNEKGEIVVKTPYLMKHYFGQNNVEQYSSFHTGDIGYIDSEGFLFITDRKKDLIIRGGINISPQEIESILLKYPGVNEAVVIGIPKEYTGEDIIAFVRGELQAQENELKRHCSYYLAQFKVPSRIIILDKDFPRSVTGKIKRNVLKEELTQNYL